VSQNISSTTTAGRILFVTTRWCNYSLFELLIIGECFTRNIKSCLQGIKYCTKVSSCWNNLTLTHDARIHEHKKKKYWSLGNLKQSYARSVEGSIWQKLPLWRSINHPVTIRCSVKHIKKISQTTDTFKSKSAGGWRTAVKNSVIYWGSVL
jgi:hypothetical protein